MSIEKTTAFVELFRQSFISRSLRGLIVIMVLAASTAGAAAAPMTQSATFGLDTPSVATFDTNIGALLQIDLSISTAVTGRNPFIDSPERSNDMCSASVSGAQLTISAPGTPTLLAAAPVPSVDNQPCDTSDFFLYTLASTTIDPALFGAFISAGPDMLTLLVSAVVQSATVTASNPTEVREALFGWIGGGRVTYTYCPAGEVCAETPAPVPEPATVGMLTLGLATLLSRRRQSSASEKP